MVKTLMGFIDLKLCKNTSGFIPLIIPKPDEKHNTIFIFARDLTFVIEIIKFDSYS